MSLSEQDREAIKELRHQGMTPAVISEKLGLSDSVVIRAIWESKRGFGVNVREKSDRRNA